MGGDHHDVMSEQLSELFTSRPSHPQNLDEKNVHLNPPLNDLRQDFDSGIRFHDHTRNNISGLECSLDKSNNIKHTTDRNS